MFDAVLVANRGEVAVRVVRACRELGVRAIAVCSEADRDALHVRMADEAHVLGGTAAADSYLDAQRIVEVARASGADAVHPGWGFLAEDPAFAAAVVDAGLVFVGPSPEVIARMGDKLAARAAARAAGVPVVPGTDAPTADPDEALAFAAAHGYPIAVKAVHGGGGRGLKIVRDPTGVREALAAAEREAAGAFGRGACYLERFVDRPRHVEVQVLADRDGTTVVLGDRDCSLQRRHQKLVEEAPAPALPAHVREGLHAAAARLARGIGYTGAGTCEFLVAGDDWWFLEMNTRLQVEHPVTELVTGVDLVAAQLRIAAGDGMGLTQGDVAVRGHAIEARINAEDPAAGFAPAPGRITALRLPQGPWVRVDAGVEAGDAVPGAYDSLLAKVVVWGPDRDGARARLRRALDELVVAGVPTTAPFARLAVDHPDFAAARHSTASVESWDLSALPAAAAPVPAADPPPAPGPPVAPAPLREVELTLADGPLRVAVYAADGSGSTAARAARQARARRAAVDGRPRADDPAVRSPITGVVVAYAVAVGARVRTGDLVCVVEAMKMENHVVAHRDGTVTAIAHAVGDTVEQGAALATIAQEADDEGA